MSYLVIRIGTSDMQGLSLVKVKLFADDVDEDFFVGEVEFLLLCWASLWLGLRYGVPLF